LIRQALRQRPDFPAALQALAALWRGQSRLSEARVLLQQAHRLLPDEASIAADLGSLLFDLGRAEEAASLFRNIVARMTSSSLSSWAEPLGAIRGCAV
jgi:Flp pilus assembly protein TadD